MKENYKIGFEIEFRDADLQILAKTIREELDFSIKAYKDYIKSSGKTWMIKYDRSVSDYAVDDNFPPHKSERIWGGELTTPVFNSNDISVFNSLRKIHALILKCGGTFDESCGFHMHFTVKCDPFKVLVVMLKNEFEIYRRVPKNRWNNIYTQNIRTVSKRTFPKPGSRITELYLQKTVAEKLCILTKHMKLTRENFEEHNTAFNFRKVGKDMVCEFRLFPSTENFAQMMANFSYILKLIHEAHNVNINIVDYLN